jgi:hypothetical protein
MGVYVSVNIIVRFPDSLAAKLKEHQARTGCSMSEFIRRAVTEKLEPKTPSKEEK